MDSILDKAYDPEAFRREGRRLIDLLADYLADTRSGPAGPAANYSVPEVELQRWEADYRGGPHADPYPLWEDVLNGSVKLHRRNYMGHQISAPVPVAALAGLLGDFINNGMGIYEMGAPGTAIERVVVQTVARAMGLAPEADGVLTSGGTLANLTALLCARSVKASQPVWREGDDGRLALMVSAEAHYCVDRAARIMGWGDEGIIKVPVDDRYRLRTDLLEEYLVRARAEGREVIALVGSACTTATGSFDDLPALADFCNKNDLWFHVDGAHGGGCVFSDKYRHLVEGIERADSVVMDFHKMLLTPSVTTALLFRDGRHSFRTFSQRADYLFAQQTDQEWFNLAKRTFECTKLMMGAKVYAILRTYGVELFNEYVTQVNDLGRTLGRLIRERPAFELAMAPQCNIVCFRLLGNLTDEDRVDELNEQVRRQMLEEGDFYIVQTGLGGRTWLRTTLTGPFTTETELRALLDRLEEMAARVVMSHES